MIYRNIKAYINKYPAKVQIYLSAIFSLILLYNVQEIIPQELYQIMILGFVLAPLMIYWFTVLIFKQE